MAWSCHLEWVLYCVHLRGSPSTYGQESSIGSNKCLWLIPTSESQNNDIHQLDNELQIHNLEIAKMKHYIF